MRSSTSVFAGSTPVGAATAGAAVGATAAGGAATGAGAISAGGDFGGSIANAGAETRAIDVTQTNLLRMNSP
ncbi:hypothetical protein FJQ54_11710 [Sandaracinobacter neustonicus]|uniref:Uncharacterized protein n=1 Tax=Sandaracinobacter neustonicus TaxID=1715348 RepID=A0A501XHW7_9SPHN|nr:hypothetical protein FJQ54_11710 [Sandaracinobacter neustonicus]